MNKYVISVKGAEGCNPEYAPDERLNKGLETDGFFLCTFKDGQPQVTTVMGCTTMEIAMLFAGDKSEAGSVIRQAAALAEGIRKAKEIEQQDDRNRSAGELLRKLLNN